MLHTPCFLLYCSWLGGLAGLEGNTSGLHSLSSDAADMVQSHVLILTTTCRHIIIAYPLYRLKNGDTEKLSNLLKATQPGFEPKQSPEPKLLTLGSCVSQKRPEFLTRCSRPFQPWAACPASFHTSTQLLSLLQAPCWTEPVTSAQAVPPPMLSFPIASADRLSFSPPLPLEALHESLPRLKPLQSHSTMQHITFFLKNILCIIF